MVRSTAIFGLFLACLIVCTTAIIADEGADAKIDAKKPVSTFRKLAPGVERVIEPEFKLDGTANKIVARHDLIEILAADPNYGEREAAPGMSPAKAVRFEQTVDALRFSFKPLRMVQVDLPTPNDRMEQKLVWYLLFHVTNTSLDRDVLFVPRFWIEDLDKKTVYPAQIVPVATSVIRRREDPNRPLANVVQIAGTLEPGQDVWGVATWSDLSPSLKRISVFVQGLSTAYKWEDDGKQRKYRQQTLQLNFWRPADPFYEHEDEIRFGLPGDVDYRWLYR